MTARINVSGGTSEVESAAGSSLFAVGRSTDQCGVERFRQRIGPTDIYEANVVRINEIKAVNLVGNLSDDGGQTNILHRWHIDRLLENGRLVVELQAPPEAEIDKENCDQLAA